MTRINLIRSTVEQPTRRQREREFLGSFIILAAVVALHLVETMWMDSVTEERDSLQRNVAGLERAIAQRRANPRAEVATQAAHPSPMVVRLRSIASSVPPGLWLVAYREYQGEATMRGVSLNDETTRTFVESLSATPGFGRLEITESTRTEGGDPANRRAGTLYEFQLKATLQDVSVTPVQGAHSIG